MNSLMTIILENATFSYEFQPKNAGISQHLFILSNAQIGKNVEIIHQIAGIL